MKHIAFWRGAVLALALAGVPFEGMAQQAPTAPASDRDVPLPVKTQALDQSQSTSAVPTEASEPVQAAAANPTPSPAVPLRSDDQAQGEDHTHSEIFRGTGVFMSPPGVERTKARQGDVTLNFVGLNVQDVAKAVLGDLLGLNYTVDPSAQGTVSVETTGPVRRDQILGIFESALEASKLALVQNGALYSIVPLATAQKRGAAVDPANAGYGSEAVSLRYVNAAELKKILDPMAPDGGITQADSARNVLFISGAKSQRDSLRRLIRQFDVNWLKGMSFALFVPQWSDSQSLAAQLTQVLGSEGIPTSGLVRVVPVPQVNGVLVISSQPDYLDRIRQLVETLDRGGESGQPRLFVYHVQNGRAADLAAVLSASYGGSSGSNAGSDTSPSSLANAGHQNPTGTSTTSSSGRPDTSGAGFGDSSGSKTQTSARVLQVGGGKEVTITADETNNALVVRAVPHQYDLILSALRKLDVRPLQVMIQAAIAEVTLTRDMNYGVQWFFQKGQNTYSLTQSSTSAQPTSIYPGFNYFYANGAGITATLNALAAVTKVNVVSSPQIFVLNNRTAVLQVGDEVPVTTQTTVSVESSTSPVVNSVEYRNTGVILKATPRVNDSGLVLLDIAQEVSEVTTTSSSKIDSPTIQQRRISSSIAVQDGQTIALGGLIKDRTSNGKTGIPYLSEIPLIGSAFGATEVKHDRTELVVLLTPHVVRNEADAEAVMDEITKTIHDIEPLLLRRKAKP